MQVLVTVKAYPQPSKSYGETVCVAGVLMGVGIAVVCAPVLGFVTASTVRDSRAAVEELPEHQRAVVERAAPRGPVPEDDALREAAPHPVEDRLLTVRATRTRALALPAVVALVAPARLERRAELLRRAG
ncbi:hypothetical protein [Blastococcus sp. SYSU DS0533]